MKDGQFYQISGWMGKYLGLRGNDLICFAIIYGFSMDGESQFKGNLNYLAECMFATQPTALLSLKHLLSCNLILKQENIVDGKKRCYYSTNVIFNDGKFEVIDTTKEPLVMTTKESLAHTTKEPLAKNNNSNNKEENKKEKVNQKEVFPFEDFYKLYPKKKSRSTAENIWKHLSEKEKKEAIDKLPAYIADCIENEREFKYPSTYLRQKTWEDDFGQESEEIPEERLDGWERSQEWMRKFIPRIAGRITFTDFDTMRGTVYHNREVFSDILQEINNSDYEGDIVKEFCRLSQTEEYNKRILGI